MSGENAFVHHGVVPDVIDAAPEKEMQIEYSSGVKVLLGNELTPTQTQNQPHLVSWPAEKGALYTVTMVDPDALSRQNPVLAQYTHLLVGNVPGNEIGKGTALFEYMGPAPPQDTGLHRYVWLVYKQPAHIDFKQATVPKGLSENRPHFSVKKFAAKWNLGSPIAGNFFQAKHEQ